MEDRQERRGKREQEIETEREKEEWQAAEST